MPKRLRWTRGKTLGEWYGYEVNNTGAPGTEVAIAFKSGTHLDDYPWDWYLTTYGTTLVPDRPGACSDVVNHNKPCVHKPSMHRRVHAGVTDTLRAAKVAVEETLA